MPDLEPALRLMPLAEREVIRLDLAGHLGYLAPSQEWTDGLGEPLDDDEQNAADRLYHAGLLSKQFSEDCGLPPRSPSTPKEA